VPDALWSFEPKLDGWRAMVYVDGGVTVRTRTGRNITNQLPELASLAAVIGGPCILDGELVTGAGRPGDFYWVAPRMSMRPGHPKRGPLTFVAFDLLCDQTGSTTRLPYRERRARLEALNLTGRAWATVSAFGDDVRALMAACEQLRLEGIVAKRADSPYRPGVRSADWLKLKTAEWRAVHAPFRHCATTRLSARHQLDQPNMPGSSRAHCAYDTPSKDVKHWALVKSWASTKTAPFVPMCNRPLVALHKSTAT
jgi:ATP-dependent DNA ligase